MKNITRYWKKWNEINKKRKNMWKNETIGNKISKKYFKDIKHENKEQKIIQKKLKNSGLLLLIN